MKTNKRPSNQKCYDILISLGTIVIFSLLQCLFRASANIEFSVLEKDFLEIYSFIVGVLSLFGVYFAIIQFSLQLKGDKSIYFGIDYVSYLQNSSKIYQFSTSIVFFASLFLFITLPILFKLGLFSILFEKIWNSICLFLLCLFVLLLYEGLTQILEIADENVKKKRDKIFTKKVKDANQSLQLLYNKDMERMPETSKIQYFFMQTKLEINTIINSGSTNYEFEKQYYLNFLLDSLDNKSKVSSKNAVYFLVGYINILKEYKIELLLDRKENHNYYYPLLDGFTSMQIKIDNEVIPENYINELRDFFEKQNFIESPILIQFVLSNYLFFSKVNLGQLTKFIDLIINLESFNIEELEYQLFVLGTFDDKVDSPLSKLICYIWTHLFELYEKETVNLNFPVEHKFDFQDFFGNRTEFIYDKNWYYIALRDFVRKNPKSNISKEGRLITS
ncbi:hypothetical protein ACTGWU_07665 [Streptococcus suis]